MKHFLPIASLVVLFCRETTAGGELPGTQFGPWSDWSQCSATCDGGETTRRRTCLNKKCKENFLEERQFCNEQPCVVPRPEVYPEPQRYGNSRVHVYKITTLTSADQKDVVSLKLFLTINSETSEGPKSNKFLLNNNNNNNESFSTFGPGETDEFIINSSSDLAEIKSIKLEATFEDSSANCGWDVRKVTIRQESSGYEVYFVNNEPLEPGGVLLLEAQSQETSIYDDDDDNGVDDDEYAPTSPKPSFLYQITTLTSEDQTPLSPGDVTLTINPEGASSVSFKLTNERPSNFDRGAMDSFVYESDVDLGKIDSIKLEFRPKFSQKYGNFLWMMRKIIIASKSSGYKVTFYFNGSVGADDLAVVLRISRPATIPAPNYNYREKSSETARVYDTSTLSTSPPRIVNTYKVPQDVGYYKGKKETPKPTEGYQKYPTYNKDEGDDDDDEFYGYQNPQKTYEKQADAYPVDVETQAPRIVNPYKVPKKYYKEKKETSKPAEAYQTYPTAKTAYQTYPTAKKAYQTYPTAKKDEDEDYDDDDEFYGYKTPQKTYEKQTEEKKETPKTTEGYQKYKTTKKDKEDDDHDGFYDDDEEEIYRPDIEDAEPTIPTTATQEYDYQLRTVTSVDSPSLAGGFISIVINAKTTTASPKIQLGDKYEGNFKPGKTDTFTFKLHIDYSTFESLHIEYDNSLMPDPEVKLAEILITNVARNLSQKFRYNGTIGPSRQNKSVTLYPSIDGWWCKWSPFSKPPMTCLRVGQPQPILRRARKCNCPAPINYGLTCEGLDRETQAATLPTCSSGKYY